MPSASVPSASVASPSVPSRRVAVGAVARPCRRHHPPGSGASARGVAGGHVVVVQRLVSHGASWACGRRTVHHRWRCTPGSRGSFGPRLAFEPCPPTHPQRTTRPSPGTSPTTGCSPCGLDRPGPAQRVHGRDGRRARRTRSAAPAADDDVRAVVVTGRGRAFCAGMDLSRRGQRVRPRRVAAPDARRTCATARRPGDPARGRATPAAGSRSRSSTAQAGDRRDQRPRGRHRRHDDAGDGRPAGLRRRPGSASSSARIGIVPEAASTWFLPRIVGISPGPRVGLLRRHPRRRRRPTRAARPLGARARRAAGRGVRAGPEVHRGPVAGRRRPSRGR